MADWSDKQLRSHKKAQGYISATGATLGIGALGAAGLKSKAAQKGAIKLSRKVGGNKGGAKLIRVTRKAGEQVQPLTVGSAGVGGFGGYNFAAIQSQESRKAKVSKAWDKYKGLHPLITHEEADATRKQWMKDAAVTLGGTGLAVGGLGTAYYNQHTGAADIANGINSAYAARKTAKGRPGRYEGPGAPPGVKVVETKFTPNKVKTKPGSLGVHGAPEGSYKARGRLDQAAHRAWRGTKSAGRVTRTIATGSPKGAMLLGGLAAGYGGVNMANRGSENIMRNAAATEARLRQRKREAKKRESVGKSIWDVDHGVTPWRS